MFYDGDSRVVPPEDTALVCLNGHVLNAHLEELSSPPKHCRTCGASAISHCPHCNARLLGDYPHVRGFMTTPPPFCYECGNAYPWYADAIERANRIIEMQIALHNIDDATAGELRRFAGDIVRDKVTPQEVETFGQWFRKIGGVDAAKAIGNALKDICTGVIASFITKTMTGGT